MSKKTIKDLMDFLEGRDPASPIELWGSIDEDGTGWLNTEGAEFTNKP